MDFRSLTFDAKTTVKGKFKPSLAAEKQFYTALRKVAKVSGHIVEAHVEGTTLKNEKQMLEALQRYSELIGPWATRQSAKLLTQVQKSNKRAYQSKAKTIGKTLEKELSTKEYGGALALDLLNEQVALIKSIPLEAGLRAQDLAYRAFLEGTRAEPDRDTIDEIQKQLGLSTEVAINRARLISRTETARANASINESRARSVGSDQYRWHNSGDGAVRHSHKVYEGRPLQGRIFSWDKPPTLDDGMKGHPGTFPNCRCFAEPVFPDE